MKDNLMGMTLGSDPELMLFDNTKGKIVSSIPVLKRDKHDPIDLGDGARMYADNVLVETSFPPSTTKEGFVESIRSVLRRMQGNLGNNYRLVPQASHIYDSEELQDDKAKESGCNDNFHVYEGTKGPPPKFTNGLRTGSFHIHIGHENLLDFDNKDRAIKMLDIFLGCGSVIFDRDETSAARRALYGKAGEFRPTKYGIEYRVLGNFALRSPKTTELVVDLVARSIGHVLDGTADGVIASIPQEDVVNAINSNMKGMAKSVLLRAGIEKDLFDRVTKTYEPSLYHAWGI